MKHYRSIETGRDPVTDAEISRIRPAFSTLTEKMKGKGLNRSRPPVRRIMVAGLSAAVVGGLVLLWALYFRKAPDEGVVPDGPLQIAERLEPRVITPPEPDMLDYEYFSIAPGKSSTVSSRKGTRISIPDDAFVYPDGTPCRDNIDLRYIEFHNVAEIFLSGVPMQYDSAGVEFTFESAGMFDIRAFSGDQGLLLAKGKEITVDLVSNAREPFNIYYFDTLRGGWQYIDTEAEEALVPFPKVDSGREVDVRKKTAYPEPSKEIVPEEDAPIQVIRKRNPANYAFKIDYDETQFPELKGIGDLIFEVVDSTIETQYLRRTTWDSIALNRCDQGTGYSINLYRWDKSFNFLARPVLNAAEYETSISQYTKRVSQREAEQVQRMNSSAYQLASNQRNASNMEQWALSRSVVVINLGTWNCDRPVPMPMRPATMLAQLVGTHGDAIIPHTIYVAQRGVNILWSYNPSREAPKYSKVKENLMWFVLPDGQYGLISDQQIRSGSTVLEPTLVDAKTALEHLKNYI